MTLTAGKLRAELTTLSAIERAELAHFLILSLDDGSDPDADRAWDDELKRRAEEIGSGNAIGEPADKVFSELRAKYS